MIKEIKYKGYTATPSDYESPDGELAAAVNLIPKDGSIKAINMPEAVGSLNSGETLVFVHVVNSGTKNLIIKDGNSLYYRQGTSARVLIKTYSTNTFKCTATGNVLCVYNVGTMDHFVFLRGNYQPFSTEDYAVTVLFGLDSTLTSNSKTITGILQDANGQSVSTWENVVSHDYSRTGINGVNINCNLTSGQTYRIHVSKNTATSTIYYKVEMHDASDNWVALEAGATGNYFQFTPTMNVVRIYVAFYSNSEYSRLANLSFSGTITIDRQVSQIQPSGTYIYNPVEAVNTELLGLANTMLANAKNNNRFILPFFVRYGFRMITGDIITVSPPILMEPNTEVTPAIILSNITQTSGSSILFNALVTAKAYSSKLQYKVKDLSKLRSLLEIEDLVDSLVIAISDPIYLYKEGATLQECRDSIFVTSSAPSNQSYSIDGVKTITGSGDYYLTLPHFDNYEERATSVSVFKIVKEIKKSDISQVDDFVDVSLETGTLNGLSGNATKIPDNADNLSSYDAIYALSYNQREHWVGVIDCQFGGFDLDAMCGYVGTTEHYTNYKIGFRQNDTEDLQYAVRGKKTESSLNRRWIYYPGIKAVKVIVYENFYIYDMTLTPHPFLKGAYHLGTMNGSSTDNNQEINTPRSLITERKANMIYVSAQANPILVEQKLCVGDGELRAAASNVRPITRNQFGQVPLYAFSTDGVWAIEVDMDGKYSVRQSVSRDVLTNVDSITQIDGAVLFATDRGVMMLVGSDTQCISQPINTENPFLLSSLGASFTQYLSNNASQVSGYSPVAFRTFLSGCRMIFDYVNQCIILYNPSKSYAYIYSLEEKLWGLMTSNILYSVNSYPEAWAVDSSNNIVNFSDATPNSSPIIGLLITRPLKLDAPDVLKTIDTVLQRGVFRDKTVQSVTTKPVKTILYGSRDLYNWQLIYSSTDHRLRGFRGTPYKYFRIVLLTHLTPDESITGCTIQYTPRLLDQPR